MSALELTTTQRGVHTESFTSNTMLISPINVPWAQGEKDVSLGIVQEAGRTARVANIIKAGPEELLRLAREVQRVRGSGAANLAVERYVRARLTGEYAGIRVTKLNSPSQTSPDVFILTTGENEDPNSEKVFIAAPKGVSRLTLLVAAVTRRTDSVRALRIFESYGYKAERGRI